jgi:hypothetical protein
VLTAPHGRPDQSCKPNDWAKNICNFGSRIFRMHDSKDDDDILKYKLIMVKLITRFAKFWTKIDFMM